MPDINVFKFKIENLIKQSKKGKIPKVYNSIYNMAERIAEKEIKEYIEKRWKAAPRGSARCDVGNRYAKVDEVNAYRKERIKFHIDRMEKLLEMSLKYQSEQQK